MKIEIPGVSNSQIVVFDGVEGLRTVTRNSLEAIGILRIYEMSYASLNEFLPRDEADEVRREFLRRKTKIRELTTSAFQERFTSVEGFNENCMEYRYLAPEKLPLSCEILTYNDTVAFYSYPNPMYAVEIRAESYAKVQQTIFDLIWDRAERPVIGTSGRTSIV